MTRRTARRLLWIVVLTSLPVPFFLGEPDLAPVLRQAFLTGMMGAVLAIIAISLFAASLSEIYETPLSSSRSRSSLLQILE